MSFLPEEGPGVDMDDLFNAWKRTAELEKRVYLEEHMLESLQADLMSRALSDTKLWINGKPPTSVYLEKVISVIGLTEDDRTSLRTLVKSLGESKQEYIKAKGRLDVLHETIRIYQTRSANARRVLAVE